MRSSSDKNHSGTSEDDNRSSSKSIDFETKLSASISTEINSESSSRAVDALTDLIRPISESFGWLGDKIQLSRQKTLTEIMRRTKERLDNSDKHIEAVSHKFLLPLLEKASLEDIDEDKLIDMWSNLIATTLTDKVELIGQYAQIMSHITSNQAKIIEEIVNLNGLEGGTVDHYIDNYFYYNINGMPGSVERVEEHSANIDDFAAKLAEEFNKTGICIDTLEIFDAENPDIAISTGAVFGIYSDDLYLDFENLCRLGLIQKVECFSRLVGRFSVDVHYYIITPIGADFLSCCGVGGIQRR
ncbi:MAG: DUF4393 domain-containing protein [Oceanicaulis sp.]|nr:DUF4393 domain-containing protein [Oceanicaulis sp.]